MKYVSNSDGHITHITQKTVENATFNMLIIHGMAEHRFRYDAFIKELNEHKINAYAVDLRGHGKSPHEEKMGHFADDNGFEKNVDDLYAILQKIKNKSDLPIILFGHSMGSLFARALIRKYPDQIDALILSGSPYFPKGFNLIKRLLVIPKKLSPHKPAQKIADMTNDAFMKDIEDKRTDLDWLSFDSKNVDNFINDPLCNFPFTYAGYYDLFKLMEAVYQKPWHKPTKDIPVLFLIGKYDPCPDFKRGGYDAALNKLKHEGYVNIEPIIYEHSRHELLQDVEKEKVTDVILHFIHDLSA